MPEKPAALLTADDLFNRPDDGRAYELRRGELIEMSPTGGQHGRISIRIGGLLDQFVLTHGLGVVYGAETGFLLARDPDVVRAPDVAFLSAERAAEIGDTERFLPGAPDLAIEIVSPNDRYTEIDDKVGEYLDAGCRMVVVVNPRTRLTRVYRTLTDSLTLTEADTLDGGEVVPGWRLPLSELFV